MRCFYYIYLNIYCNVFEMVKYKTKVPVLKYFDW